MIVGENKFEKIENKYNVYLTYIMNVHLKQKEKKKINIKKIMSIIIEDKQYSSRILINIFFHYNQRNIFVIWKVRVLITTRIGRLKRLCANFIIFFIINLKEQ